MENEQHALDAKYEAQKIAFAPVVFQVARVLRDKGVLDLLKRRSRTDESVSIETIGKETGLGVYALRVLLEMAALAGIVKRTDDERFAITKTGFFIASDPLTNVNMDFIHDVCYKGLFHLDKAIETGKPEGLKELGDWPTIYEGLSQLDPKVQQSWFAFDHYYSDDSFPEALPILFRDKPEKVVDIGGNTGKFSIACCKYDPDVKMTIVDLPGQVKMANENIAAHGLQKRVNFFPVDMLRPDRKLPEADIYWMSQFLDCFSEEQVVAILKHVVASMPANASVYIMETFWDYQEFPASKFSLAATSVYFTVMANGNSKMYGREPFIGLIEKAGLKVEEVFPPVGISHTILKCGL